MEEKQLAVKKYTGIAAFVMGIFIMSFSLILLFFSYSTHETLKFEYILFLILGLIFEELGNKILEKSNHMFLRGVVLFVIGSIIMIDAVTFSLLSKTLNENRSINFYLYSGAIGAIFILASKKVVNMSKKK